MFSATERERLHGHNFNVYASFSGEVDSNGMLSDYGQLKKTVLEICRSLNEYTLLPENSPFLKISQTGDQIQALFNNEVIPFLKKDVLLLPIRNITVEELAKYFLGRLQSQLDFNQFRQVTVKVFSGPGQCGSAEYNA